MTDATIAAVQKRINAATPAMSAKGLRKPEASFDIRANVAPRICLAWDDKKSAYRRKYEWVKGDTATVSLNNMDAFIAGLPSPEETRMQEFMTALSGAIELGRENGIDVDFINPLAETMKRLSENAITYQRAA